jgi:hypothetical protein
MALTRRDFVVAEATTYKASVHRDFPYGEQKAKMIFSAAWNPEPAASPSPTFKA